jgi:hypothetical protein
MGLNTPFKNEYDPLPFSEHQAGIIFDISLGELVQYSSLRNSVFIYSGGRNQFDSTFVNLLPFGMSVGKSLVDHFDDQFINLVCDESSEFENFNKSCTCNN